MRHDNEAISKHRHYRAPVYLEIHEQFYNKNKLLPKSKKHASVFFVMIYEIDRSRIY